MTKLLQRMREELQLRNSSEETITTYLGCVVLTARRPAHSRSVIGDCVSRRSLCGENGAEMPPTADQQRTTRAQYMVPFVMFVLP